MRGDGRIFQKPDTPFWHCAYYLHGKQIRETTGETDEAKARRFLKGKIKEVHLDQIGARAFIAPQQQRVSVTEMLDVLETDYRFDGKDSPQFRTHLKTIRAHFGDCRAVNVSSDAIDEFIEARLQEYKPATINRCTQLLGQAFKLSVKKQKLNSAPHIRHLSEKDNVRQGFFEDWEFRAVESNLPDYLRDYAHFAYRTGWRKGSIAKLEWQHYDGRSVRLPGKDWKNGEAQQVMLDADLADLIDRRQKARAVKTKTGVILGVCRK